MKITLLAHTVPRSGVVGISTGISRYISCLSEELVKRGNEVELLLRDDFKPDRPWIKTVFSPKFSWMPYPLFLYLKLRKIQSDVYHSDYVTTGAPLAWGKKNPSVVSMHDAIPFTYKKGELSFADKIRVMWYMKCFRDIQSANAVIVASEFAKGEVLKYTKIPEEKIHAIHYGVDHSMLYPEEKDKSDTVKIGYLGGLDGRKNVELLLESFKKLVERNENVELHIGGTGKNLERFVEMKIPNTYFHGFINPQEIRKFLNTLDVFVFPTLLEGFGMPCLEAMACGLPVIACNVATMPEILDTSGVLVSPNSDDMSNGIENLVRDEKYRKDIANKCHQRSLEFIWEKCADETLKVYNKVIER